MTTAIKCLVAAVLLIQPSVQWRGFDNTVALSIEKTIAGNSKNADVVFDADGTLWKGDVGESFFIWELDNKKFLPPQQAQAQQMWQAYTDKRLSERDMWIAAATLQNGLRESDVQRWAASFFRANFQDRIFPAMQSAIANLQRRGVRVWIVSASHRWIIEAGADYLHVRRSNVIAISAKVKDGRITGEVINPVPFQAGKVEAIRGHLSTLPFIAFSDSINDLPMLELATTSRVVINPDERLRTTAMSRGWSVQDFK
jgi:phosphatidylglycerophosphatase C